MPSLPSLPPLPSLQSLSLCPRPRTHAAPTGAPGTNNPTLRDIAELEFLLKRLYEVKERDDPPEGEWWRRWWGGGATQGKLILSDEGQLNRMLYSLKVLYASTAGEQPPTGGTPMTEADVDALNEILFELGHAQKSENAACRSFFSNAGVYQRMYDFLYQLGPGPRGDEARAAAERNAADERRLREEESDRRLWEETQRALEAARQQRDSPRPLVTPDMPVFVTELPSFEELTVSDDSHVYLHPALKKGWDEFLTALVWMRVQRDGYGSYGGFARTRQIATAEIRRFARTHKLPTRLFCAGLLARLGGVRSEQSQSDAVSEMLDLAMHHIREEVEHHVDFKAAVQIRDAMMERYGTNSRNDFHVTNGDLFNWVIDEPALRTVASGLAGLYLLSVAEVRVQLLEKRDEMMNAADDDADDDDDDDDDDDPLFPE